MRWPATSRRCSSASAAATSRFLSMQAVFPSITEVGMPALLPHQALGLAAGWCRLCWLTASPPQRLRNARPCLPMLSLRPALYARAHTSTWREPSVRRCSRTQDLFTSTTTRSMPRARRPLRRMTSSVPVRTPWRKLAALARRVCTDAPGARVVITADHGFIYTRRELSECQMLGKPDLPVLDAPVMYGKRHLVVPNEAVGELSDEVRGVFVNVNMGRLVRLVLRGLPRARTCTSSVPAALTTTSTAA